MPKKRQTAKSLILKPPSTAHRPPAQAASESSSQNKSVNEILAGLRQSGGGGGGPGPASASAMLAQERTLPPEVRQILQIPEVPPPPPRRPLGVNGRRLPAGPPPPRSWQIASAEWRNAGRPPLGGSVRGSGSVATGSGFGPAETFQDPLPGTYHPRHGSLVDMALRAMAHDWEFQASYNRFHLYTLPSRSRVSLIRYISLWSPQGGVTVHDMRLLLAGPPPEEMQEYGVDEVHAPLNDDIFQLDICGSLGRSVKVKELADLLFPSRQAQAESEPLDSWETAPLHAPLPVLLPHLTHLSLGIMPLSTPATAPTPPNMPSWQDLLVHASKLSALTHLSLAHWPVPSRTQNAKLASMVQASAGGSSRSVQYGGTGPYSHSLDDDFSEAVSVMRHLARALYRLEHLDLTGCSGWCVEALTRADAAGNMVDWLGDWGQLTVLRVGSGEVGREQRSVLLAPANVSGALMSKADAGRVAGARRIERHVIARRSGVGRPITVETDWGEDDELSLAMSLLSM